MIKRNGIEVLNKRTKNVSLAKEVIDILDQGYYISPSGQKVDISNHLDFAIKGTQYYPSDNCFFTSCYNDSCKIEVTNETTAQASSRLISEGKEVVALNFASARNQGGGFLGGAVAQEEDLCRASGLYNCLKSKPMFYNNNIMCDDTFYTDGVIYSPNVPFFRDQDGNFLEAPFMASIISAPAPNISSIKNNIDNDVLKNILMNRAIRILEIASLHRHKNIVLGAWGCGAFGNSPDMVARVFQSALKIISSFENVCFAVYDNREPPIVYETFKKIFNPL